VFVVGGGNYIEYQNLIDYIKVCALLPVVVCKLLVETSFSRFSVTFGV